MSLHPTPTHQQPYTVKLDDAREDATLPCRGQGQTYTDVLSDINIFFTAVYVTEAVLKNTAFGPWRYIKDNWWVPFPSLVTQQ